MGLGRGWACIGIQITLRLGPGYKDRVKWGRFGPSGARAEWGWGGVGHALGSNSITLSGAAWGRADWGRV